VPIPLEADWKRQTDCEENVATHFRRSVGPINTILIVLVVLLVLR